MWLALQIACSTPSSTSVTVQAAPAAEARRLAVTGGELRVELMTTWSPDCAEGATCRSVFVAPLVPLDWLWAGYRWLAWGKHCGGAAHRPGEADALRCGTDTVGVVCI